MNNDELEKLLRKIVREENEPLKKDLQEVKTTQQEMQTTLKDHTRRLRGLKMILTRVKKDLHYVSGDYDQRIVENLREIEKIKEHVGLSTPTKN